MSVMNLEHLRTKLISAARHKAVDESVPYLFENRFMARIASKPAEDPWRVWGNALWKGAAACAALTALCIGLTFWTSDDNSGDPFENVLLAGADQLTDTW
jgi:hypothetical protein